MTLENTIKRLLKEGYSGNEIQKLLPAYGFKKRRQVLQGLIRDISGIKKKLSTKPWNDLPQPTIKPKSKLEGWKRAVSTSSKYTNIYYNYYATFYVSWTDEIGFFHDGYFTKFLGLMNFQKFKRDRAKLISKAERELLEDLSQSPNYEDKLALEIHEVRLIEIFRHKHGTLK